MANFQLPEPIIQRIQSFLNAKQAAHTTTLSKSWRKAWLTRPNLDFDESDFQRNRYFCAKINEFSQFAKNTIQRYEESKLKIETLRLFLEQRSWHRDSGFVRELIVKALKLGAAHLNIRPNDSVFVLPHEVLVAENLVGLSIEGCRIDLGLDRMLRCSRLKSLSLSRVDIDSDLISHTISSFPLIEKLSLDSIYDLKRGVSKCLINLHKLHKLRCLVMCRVQIHSLFFCKLSSEFPSLKDLTLQSCDFENDILISSCSLESLNFVEHKSLRVKLDVPSIRKFTFEGSVIPLLSFKSTSREWESHVSVNYYHSLSMLWFRTLNKFLTELSSSKIHLSLNVISGMSFDYEVGDILGLPKPKVENLTMETCLPSLTCYALFDGLFRLCRPKFVTKYLLPESSIGDDFLCKALVQGMNEKCSIRSHCMYGLHDLEEVNVQIFDQVVAVWRDMPWKTFLDASMSSKDEQKIRFQLKWKS